MLKYILRRFLQAVPTFFGITLLSYGLLVLAPGDPARLITHDPRLSIAQRELVARQMGLDEPIYVQYLIWLIGNDWRLVDRDGDGIAAEYGDRLGILRGDFGRSLQGRRPAMDVIMERIPATLELGTAALLVGMLFGVPTGILAAVRRGGAFDNLSRVMSVIVNAIPIFWLGLILILMFGVWIKDTPFSALALPMGGRCPPTLTGDCVPITSRLQYMILPTFVLASTYIALYSRYMRASMLEVTGQDYVRTANAKGLSPQIVWFKHAARNALIPIATFLGPAVTGILSGAAVTETIFSWPGVGRLAVDAVVSLDYALVMATVIIGSITTIIGFMISDILYAIIDPRIRFS